MYLPESLRTRPALPAEVTCEVARVVEPERRGNFRHGRVISSEEKTRAFTSASEQVFGWGESVRSSKEPR